MEQTVVSIEDHVMIKELRERIRRLTELLSQLEAIDEAIVAARSDYHGEGQQEA